MRRRPHPLHPEDVLDREPLLPSTQALRALVLAAQYRSFTRAAEELGVTQGGVSRAIKGIEGLAGRRLFERSARGLVPTEAGAVYIEQVRGLLAELGAATLRVSSYDPEALQLHVATLPSLGSLWLAPRLAGFVAEHPAVALTVTANIGIVDFAQSSVDCVIHYGSEAWPTGARSELLMQETLQPFCSPALIRPGETPGVDTILRLPLIHHTHRPSAWRDWLRQVGVVHPNPGAGCRFEQYQMGIRAAVAGLGAMLMPPMLVVEDLAAGRLVALHDAPLPSPWQYHFVYPEEKRANPALQWFRVWLLRTARASGRNPDPAA
jgi:DNA-binding transcriptional LysR family regulator